MKLFYKPDIDTTLAPLLVQGTKNGQKTREEWLEGMAHAIASMLKKNPMQYRSYGPYWWVVKKILLSFGEDHFGSFLDAEWVEKVTYGDPVWDLLAAWSYSEYALDNGLIYSNGHPVVFINDDGESEEEAYTLVDDDIETYLIG